jgi:hypothetical protein
MKKSIEERLAEMRDELARQDAEWAEVAERLEAFRHLGIPLPESFFRDFDEACTPCAALHPTTTEYIHGFRA